MGKERIKKMTSNVMAERLCVLEAIAVFLIRVPDRGFRLEQKRYPSQGAEGISLQQLISVAVWATYLYRHIRLCT